MSRYDAVVFDVDGTLLWGAEVIPGAPEAVAAARDRGSVAFVSNNPTAHPAKYAERLREGGIDADEREVVTAGSVTADLVAADYPDPALVVGETGLTELLRARGVAVTTTPEAAGTVVASIDRSFTYDRLATALAAFERERRDEADDGTPDGPALVGTDPDPVIPGDEGVVPGSGAIVDAVASVAGRRPDAMAGKPAVPAREATFEVVDAAPERTLVVGDRLDTDIAMGVRAGAETALVLSGVTDAAAVPGETAADGGDSTHEGRSASTGDRPVPDHVLDSVAALPSLLGRE